MAWDVPQFATTHGALEGGAGCLSAATMFSTASSVDAGSSIDSLRDSRLGTDCALSTAGAFVTVAWDRGAGTLAGVSRVVFPAPWSTSLAAGGLVSILVYHDDNASLSSPTVAGWNVSIPSASGTVEVVFSTPSTERYLAVYMGVLGGSLTAATYSEIIFTSQLTSTTRGPAPGWRDTTTASVEQRERPSGWTSSRAYGAQRRTWELTYERVTDATDRATLENVIDVGSRRPIVFWPAFDDSTPILARVTDWRRRHNAAAVAASATHGPTYSIELEEVLA